MTPATGPFVTSAQIRATRAASRHLVRELGFLASRARDAEVSLAECHALIELEANPESTVAQLAETLCIDKAAASRTLASLVKRRLITSRRDTTDGRRKPFALTKTGRSLLRAIHRGADRTVAAALARIDPAARDVVADSLDRYANALAGVRRAKRYEIRAITPRDDRAMAAVIREVMTEHGASGPGFAIHDAEVDAMSAAYRGRGCRYYVVTRGARVLGGGGFAPLAGARGRVCELRKMYFRPECRGLGLGRALLGRLLRDMKVAGYTRCYLETLTSMKAAQKLYREFGFAPRCGPLGRTGHFACDAYYERAL